MQISIIADSNCSDIYQDWQQDKQKNTDLEFLKTISENRIKHFKKAKFKSLFSDSSTVLKDYKLIISYTVSSSSCNTVDLINLRSVLIGILRSARIFASNLEPKLFINIFHNFFNPNDVDLALDYDENAYGKQHFVFS